jgi:hypothetical protein
MSQFQTPPKHIYDPRFVYRSAANTDIRETFERIKAQQEQRQAKKVRRVK